MLQYRLTFSKKIIKKNEEDIDSDDDEEENAINESELTLTEFNVEEHAQVHNFDQSNINTEQIGNLQCDQQK